MAERKLSEVETLKAEVAEKATEVEMLKSKLKAVEAELEATININTQLTEALERAPKAPAEEPKKESVSAETFEVDGVTYGFSLKAVYEGNDIITAAEVLTDEALQKALVAKGSGMIHAKAPSE